MTDRLTLSEAVELVGKLIDAYPNGAQTGNSYMGALAAILCQYPRVVAIKCADPARGVARATRFLPTVADLVGWCERETTEMRRPVDYSDRFNLLAIEAQKRRREGEAWDKARLWRPTVPELREQYGPTWGLKRG